MNLPLISVIMTSYNHIKYLQESIESIWRQTYPNLELIVVDDRSTDGSIELLKSLHDRSPVPMKVHVHEKNQGVVAAISKAFELSSGELISFSASDDYFEESRFENQVAKFLEDKKLAICFAQGKLINKDGSIGKFVHEQQVVGILRSSPAEILEYLYTNSSPFFLQSALVRKNILVKGNAFDREALADDWLSNIRIFEVLVSNGGKCIYLDQVVFYYRVHGENLHANFGRQLALKKQMIEKYIPVEKRRQARANIYWKIGLSLIKEKPVTAVKFLTISQLNKPKPKVLINIIKNRMHKILH